MRGFFNDYIYFGNRRERKRETFWNLEVCVIDSDLIHTHRDRKHFSSEKIIPNQRLYFIIRRRKNLGNSHSELSTRWILFVTYSHWATEALVSCQAEVQNLHHHQVLKSQIKNAVSILILTLGSEYHRIILQTEESLALNKSLLKGKQLDSLNVARWLADKATAVKPKMRIFKSISWWTNLPWFQQAKPYIQQISASLLLSVSSLYLDSIWKRICPVVLL